MVSLGKAIVHAEYTITLINKILSQENFTNCIKQFQKNLMTSLYIEKIILPTYIIKKSYTRTLHKGLSEFYMKLYFLEKCV